MCPGWESSPCMFVCVDVAYLRTYIHTQERVVCGGRYAHLWTVLVPGGFVVLMVCRTPGGVPVKGSVLVCVREPNWREYQPLSITISRFRVSSRGCKECEWSCRGWGFLSHDASILAVFFSLDSWCLSTCFPDYFLSASVAYSHEQCLLTEMSSIFEEVAYFRGHHLLTGSRLFPQRLLIPEGVEYSPGHARVLPIFESVVYF